MPFYDYSCDKCGSEFETFHSMTEKPTVRCPECDSSKTRKMVSPCGIIVRNTSAQRRCDDAVRRGSDAKQDLRENYGIENVQPLGGVSATEVYNDIKGRGTFVKDQMQAKREHADAQAQTKRREWLKKAHKRTPARAKVKKEQKAKEKAAKEAISLST